jgi:ribosomal protein L9
MGKLIKYPFGEATVSALADAATMNVTIQNSKTILKATAGFGQAVTGLSLTAHDELEDGAEVIVDIKQGATGRNVTFGSVGNAIVAPALTGVALDRDVIRLRYDKTEDKFIALSAWQKVFDAA